MIPVHRSKRDKPEAGVAAQVEQFQGEEAESERRASHLIAHLKIKMDEGGGGERKKAELTEASSC